MKLQKYGSLSSFTTTTRLGMNIELRKGKEKAVIRKSLVDLNSHPFKLFERYRYKWAKEDHYLSPGPIQFEDDPKISESTPKIL